MTIESSLQKVSTEEIQVANHCASAVTFRHAEPADAGQICELYEEEYCPPGKASAKDHYPFPQFLSPLWVATAVQQSSICWIVADLEGQVVGSAGAVRNVGSPDDRVAEIFGIVVSRSARGCGVGHGLLSHLNGIVGDDAEVLLCESRTADSRAWRVARRCGFIPIGFEPFAHATPAGSESMLMTAMLRETALRQRKQSMHVPPSALELAEAVCDNIAIQRVEPVTTNIASTSCQAPSASQIPCSTDFSKVRYFRDQSRLQVSWSSSKSGIRHNSGVICLDRLEGEDDAGIRYDRRYYHAENHGEVLACAKVVWDRTDCRARILELTSRLPGVEQGVVSLIVNDLLDSTSHVPVIVVEIRVDAYDLAKALLGMGFRPTVYYPALISDGHIRVDAVQFTRPGESCFSNSLNSLNDVDWQHASRVIASVMRPTQTSPRFLDMNLGNSP